MYFPAGIPLALLIALIAWNIREEVRRSKGQALGNSPSAAKPT